MSRPQFQRRLVAKRRLLARAGALAVLGLIVAAVVVVVSSVVSSGPQSPPTSPPGRYPAFPNTTDGIHLAMTFDYRTPRGQSLRGVDLIIAGSPPPRQGYYDTYDVPLDTTQEYDLSWWKQNHPTWIEYTCSGTPAYEFGDTTATPLDISNPAVLEWMWSNEVLPGVKRGYQGVIFDNLNLNNSLGQRCGHYDSQGSFISQYSGADGLSRYQDDVITWAGFMRAHLHRAHASMAINFSYEHAVSRQTNLRLMESTDLLADEAGVTNDGNTLNTPNPDAWLEFFNSAMQVQESGGCYFLNGSEPQDTDQISLQEREWIMANYLLIKGRCTYTWISGYRTYTQTDYAAPHPGRDVDTGGYMWFPEYGLPVGHPTGAPSQSDGVWVRDYSSGDIVLVNPSSGTLTYSTATPMYALGESATSETFTLPASSALILTVQPYPPSGAS